MAKKNQKAAQAAPAGGGDFSAKMTQLKDYFDESKVEIKKVTWPSRKETVTTCVAVLVLVLVMSLYLGVVDMGLSKIVESILS